MLRIALISDELTRESLKREANICDITPSNFKDVLNNGDFDLLFVESSWKGFEYSWQYKIASYKKELWHPSTFFKNNKTLRKVVSYAKDRGIPTIFWNKEDDVHFERFISSALLFDHIFTVDCNSVDKYRKRKDFSSVSVLPFSIPQDIHYFDGFRFSKISANFVGSYNTHFHDRRRAWQKIIFSCTSRHLGIDIFDRNSDSNSENYRYPVYENMNVLPHVPYPQTAEIYRNYAVSFNVNTITDSVSMCSRRLIEILACGGMAVSNPSASIDAMFNDYVYTFDNEEELNELLYRIETFGHTSTDFEKMRAGADYVAKNLTWKQSLEKVMEVI